MKRSSWIAVASMSMLMGCGGANPEPAPPPPSPPTAQTEPERRTPDAAFRANPPPPDGTIVFRPPSIDRLTLKNGMPVYVAARTGAGLVSVRLSTRLGAEQLGKRSGVGALLGSMLEQGTKTRSALQISDRFEELGAHHISYMSWSGGGLAITVPKERLDDAIELLADMALQPTFPADELERLRSRRLNALAQERANPSAIFANVVPSLLYGNGHPYGAALAGQERDVRAITRADLQRAHKLAFAKGQLALVVAGDVEAPRLMASLERSFGKVSGAGAAPKPPPEPTFRGGRGVAFVDKPGAQAQIGVVALGAAATASDRYALAVMNAVLGGAFSSRLNLNLREKHAYTYGARSWFEFRAGAGPFVARASVVADKTLPALQEMLNEVERMRTSDVDDTELRLAKDYLKLSLPARFETVEELASAAAELHMFGFGLDEYAQRASRYEAVTAADVRRVAEKYLDPNRRGVVVVGDRALLGDLAGMNLGAVRTVDAYGEPIAESAK